MQYFVEPRANAGASDVLRRAADDLVKNPFRPHRWLENCHVQTLLSQRPRAALRTTTSTLALDCGTVIATEELAPSETFGGDGYPPTVVCIHGMGGSSSSGYMRGIARRAAERGWGAWLLSLYDLREDGSAPEIFHAGNSSALRRVLQALLKRTRGDVYLVGVSLGGNTTLKLMGEWAQDAPEQIRGVAALSPLVDLVSAWPILERSTRLAYRVHFLDALCDLVKEHESRLSAFIDLERVYRSKTLREFDAALTVTLGGYGDVFDFYSRASAAPVLKDIRTPTLTIFSADDPVLPVAPLMAKSVRANPAVLAALTRRGGHVGFMERGAESDRSWAEERAMAFFDRLAADRFRSA